MPLVKHLARHGNSLALVIDRGILDLLDIDEKTTLSIEVAGRTMVVSPVESGGRRKKVLESLERVNRRHGRVLRRLAE